MSDPSGADEPPRTVDAPRHCEVCGARCDLGGPAPSCPEHGLRWRMVRNACGSDVLVVRDGKVLLTRRGNEPDRGCWEVPGGFADNGEHPAATAKRELLEELGVHVELIDLLGIFVYPYGGPDADFIQATVYLAETADDPRIVDGEVAEFAWFAPHELPPESAMPAGHREPLETWLRTLPDAT